MPDNQYRSNPHRHVEKVLEKLQIMFFSEHSEFPPYRVDTYLPDYHLAVETDGPQHSPNKDAVRDQWLLERYYLPTLRIKTKGPWQKFAKIEQQVIAFLEEHQDTVEERKLLWRTIHSNA
jgi:very-short-patch-repair endonuclease